MIWRMIPSQNTGIDTAAIESRRLAWSGSRPRRSPPRSPSGTPATTTISIAATVSSMVAGKNWRRSSDTGRRVVIESPRFPCSRSRM